MSTRVRSTLPAGHLIFREYDLDRQRERFEVWDADERVIWAGRSRAKLRKWMERHGALDTYNAGVADWNLADADAARVRAGHKSGFRRVDQAMRDPRDDEPTTLM